MEWQPIETAPKDGTNILISDGSSITTAYWTDEEEDYDWIEDPTQKIVYEEGWMTSDFDVGDDATHWMHLPRPPKETRR